MKIKERALSLLLSLVMVLTFMPALAFAGGEEATDAENTPVVEGPVAEEPAIEDLVEVPSENVKKEAAEEVISWYESVKSISFIPVESEESEDRFTFIKDYDLYNLIHYAWNEETQTEDEYPYKGYSYCFLSGDKIVATLEDDSIKTLVYSYNENSDEWEWYVQEDETFLTEDDPHPFFDDDQYTTPWTPGGDNYFWVVFGYYDNESNWIEVTTSKNSTKATIKELSPLEKAKYEAYDELYALIDAKYDNCRDAQKQELDRIFYDAADAIDEAESVETVNATMAAARAAIAAVKTDAQLRAEEAENARQGTDDPSLPKVKASKPKAAKKAFTAKWKKLKKKQLKSGVTNIEVWACADGAFANCSTIERVVGKKKASLKIKGMQKGVTYFVKVRAIKYVGGVKYVGPWSAVKKVKVKK